MNREFVMTELDKLGVEIADDKAKALVDAVMKENGNDINNAKSSIQKKLDEANDTIKGLQDTINSNGDNAKALEDAKARIKEYEDADKARKEREEKEKADADFTAKINPIFDELKIKNNAYIRNGLTADARAKLEADNTLGLKDIVAELIKDNDDFKVNPQQENIVIPSSFSGGKPQDNAEAIAKARAVMGLPKGKDEK